jgi:flagellar protein FlgJ
MQINPLQPKVDPSHLPLESLAANPTLTREQKIGEASRQFEAVLLRQFLSESQKPVITSEFTDNSTASGIYQDLITNQLADNLSRNGGIGLAQTFERQLSPHHAVTAKSPGAAPAIGAAPTAGTPKISHP